MDGTSEAKAYLHVVVMFWIRGIRSWSHGLQAGFASGKFDKTLRTKAQIAAKYSPSIRNTGRAGGPSSMRLGAGAARRQSDAGLHFQLALEKNKSVHLSDHRYEIAGADCGPAEKWRCHIKA